MKICTAPIQKITLSELKDLDPVDVILEDFPQSAGRLVIVCAGESWSYHWNSMGCNLREFISTTSTEYLVGKLIGNRADTNQFYLERIITAVKVGLDAMVAMEIARNPLPNVEPTLPPVGQWAKIQADDLS